MLKEFLEPLELTQKALAAHVGIPVRRVNEIVRGKRGVRPETAWLRSDALRTTPDFWLNLQSEHELSAKRPDHHVEPLVAASMQQRHVADNFQLPNFKGTEILKGSGLAP